MNNVTNNSLTLEDILKEYSCLPEYSGMELSSINTKSLFGDFPINIAATRGIKDEVLVLLSNGANVNAKGEHGYTPLHNAVEQSRKSIIEILLSVGADKTIKNDDGDEPIVLAKTLEIESFYKLLMLD